MSNIIEELDNILYAARRNSENNPRISTLENLRKYYGKDLYVTFKSLEKVGINPRAKWGHISPIGIYAYSLDYVYRVITNSPFEEFNSEFAFDKKLVYVLEQVDVPGLTFISNAANYTVEDYKNDIKKLTAKNIESKLNLQIVTKSDRKDIHENVKYFVKEISKDVRHHNALNRLYALTNHIGETYARNTKADNYDAGDNHVHRATIWNSLMRIVLGYSGFADPDNIHPAHGDINCEAIFFTNSAIKVIDSFENDYYESKVLNKQKKYSPFNVANMLVKRMYKSKTDNIKRIVTLDNGQPVDVRLVDVNGKLEVEFPDGRIIQGSDFIEFIRKLAYGYYNGEFPSSFRINVFCNNFNKTVRNKVLNDKIFNSLYNVFLHSADDIFDIYVKLNKIGG